MSGHFDKTEVKVEIGSLHGTHSLESINLDLRGATAIALPISLFGKP
jgi:hypothetical protein